jgi:putative spermidine/putrescine transport system permease protein
MATLSDRTPASLSHRQPSLLRRLSSFFYKHPNLSLLLLLLLPMAWLLVVYLGSISTMVVQSFFRIDDFTGRIIRQFSFQTYQTLFRPANLDIILRTSIMAAAVTVASALIAFPLAYYMARYASGRVRGLLYLAVMIPLWSSYLVRVYSWKLILADEGIITWFFRTFGLGGVLDAVLAIPLIGGRSLSFSFIGMFLVFVYIWLPYMILPINAALERVPKSLIEASGDLGAKPGYTFRKVILPLAFPGVVAGSIFTFSLTLGDYIIPQIVGNSSFFIGGAVNTHYGTSGNIPLAAAFTAVPIVIMGVYLLVARRLGAFDAL